MKFDLSDKKWIILLCIIAVLLAVNIFLVTQPKAPSELSLYKSFAEQTHSSIQGIKTESANILGLLVETPDMNAEQKAELELMKEFYFSMDADVKWVAEKENTVYWQLAATQNPLQANELMRKELAVLVLSNYVFGLNNDAVSDGTAGVLDEQETVDEARAALSWVQVKDLLNDEAAQQMIAETLVQKEDIIKESKDLMQQYLEIRKNALNNAAKGSAAEYVEAVKLLELSFLLEINDTNQSQ